MRLVWWFAWVAAGVTLPLWAEAPPTTHTADSVLACAGDNAPEKAFRQDVQFSVSDDSGGQRVFVARMLGQRSDKELKLNFKIKSPSDLAGMAVLIRERSLKRDELDIYLPTLRRSRRVSERMAQTKLFGTDFSYVEIKQVFGAFIEGKRTYLELAALGDRMVHRVKVTPPKSEELPFDHLIAAIDQSTCVPLAVEFRDAKNNVLKLLSGDPDSIVKLSGRYLAQSYLLEDYLTHSKTDARFSRSDYTARISAASFDSNIFQDVP